MPARLVPRSETPGSDSSNSKSRQSLRVAFRLLQANVKIA